MIRGGTYSGPFVSRLSGAPGAWIIVRPYASERVVIDGQAQPRTTTLSIYGSWTAYAGLEITNSSPLRTLPDTGAGRGVGVELLGPNVKFQNNVVHNTGVGIGFWSAAENSEVTWLGSSLSVESS
jgi:hypothetical protein